MTPEQRAMRAKVAADTRWARTADRSAATSAARDGLDARLRRDYGIPDDLPPDEDAKRMASARKAYFTSLAFKSSRARAKAAEYAREAANAEAELREAS